jgi:mgtE-like transporter
LFYVKEYGPHANVPRTIIKESIKILLLASILSSFGGLALENIKLLFISITPLIILLPALNDMIGDYGTIISARFSTALHEGKVGKKWWRNNEIRKLLWQIIIIAVITALLSSAIALIISQSSTTVAIRVLFVVLVDVLLLVSILAAVGMAAGLYFYRKGEDPNNFLIPISTSIADLGNMVILAALVLLIF